MTYHKRLLSGFAALLLGLTGLAHAADEYEAGKHYQVLPTPVYTADPGKVEVIEAFWYGCKYCYHFEPLVEAWHKQQPADVDFRRLPVVWDESMTVHSRAYYAAEALELLDKVHKPMFKAMVEDRNPMRSESDVAELFKAAAGVAAEDFDAAYNSMGVDSLVLQAKSRQRSYGVTGTPSMVVNGKYRVALEEQYVRSHEEMLKVTDFLIAKERAARAP